MVSESHECRTYWYFSTVRNLIWVILVLIDFRVFCKSIFGIGMSADNSVSVSRSGSSSRSIVVSSRRKDDEF